MLKIDNVYKNYEVGGLFYKKQISVLKGVSFELKKGENLGILGISGSGKSTLARLICALENPSSGEISLNGEIIKPTKDYRKKVQIVFQDSLSSFNPGYTVFEAISEPLDYLSNLNKNQKIERVYELLLKVHLDTNFIYQKCARLSGGQLQRVSIARAISINPEIIILDEATSSLDVSLQVQILSMLKELKNEFSFIVITHDIRIIKLFCDRVLILDDGLVVEERKVENDLKFRSDIGLALQEAILPQYPKKY